MVILIEGLARVRGGGGFVMSGNEPVFKRQLQKHAEVNQCEYGQLCVCARAWNGRFTRLEPVNKARKARHLGMTPGERYSGCRSEFRVGERFVLLFRCLSSGTESGSNITRWV